MGNRSAGISRLSPRRCSLDVEAFESALAEDEAASEKLQPLREAVELYRGDFLEGLSVRQALGF